MQECSLDLPQVQVGHDQLVGEVIRIDGDKVTAQVYEETGVFHISRCRWLSRLIRTGQPVSLLAIQS